MSPGLADLNAWAEPRARAEFLRCCGSTRWARMVAASRPFASAGALADTADAVWRSLDRADWLEAFAAHPQIGAAAAAGWAAHEQSSVQGANEALRNRLARLNRDYHDRFGYIFIVCATDRTADEMLAQLEHRLPNGPDAELAIAAEEQRKITQLRLVKLLT